MMKRDSSTLSVDSENLLSRVRRLNLHGLAARWDEIGGEPWLERLCAIEEEERKRRSLERRVKFARIGIFKPMADFDWKWPKKINREAVEDLFSLAFVEEGINAVLLGPNGVGKTMLLRNLAHHALIRGHMVRFTTASDMLCELAGLESASALRRRIQRYCKPKLLCIDEVGYLSYDSRYADLLFEVVTRRYEQGRSLVLSTNKPFSEWSQVFPNAACVVTLVDRLLHRAEIIDIEGESFRLREAKERAEAKEKARGRSRKRTP